MRISEVSAFDIARSGIKAQRLRMTVIANNIANAETTRTEKQGGPFRRQVVELVGFPIRDKFPLKKYGVEVRRVKYDLSPFKQVYEPGHPDADENGMVRYPNVNIPIEMADLITAQRGYEANISVLVATRQIRQRALEILQR